MSLAPRMRIELTVASNRVSHVAIAQGGLTPAAALLGLQADQALERAPMLYALCPVAQKFAAEGAIAAARGEAPLEDRRRDMALVAEKCRENLRALVLDWPMLAPDAGTLATLRAALAATASIAELAPGRIEQRIEALRASVDALGFAKDPPPASTWFARLRHSLASRLGDLDVFVEQIDDEDIFAALATGRELQPGPMRAMSLIRLLRARGASIGAAIAQLAALVSGEVVEGRCNTRALAHRRGAAAVDSPRGRLFHLVELDASDCVRTYRTLSPTDRNFAPGGPLARTLSGQCIGAGEAASQRVKQIVAMYDPCMEVDASIRELADA